jgi:hypothetical protein
MTALVAVDLDQTVVFSKRSAGAAGPSVVVEHLDGEALSSMTVGAVDAYRDLAATVTLVPVTTRTVAQFNRIALPSPPAYAVCANGGVLLGPDGRDAAWDAWVRTVCAASAPLPDAMAMLAVDAPWVKLVRAAEGLFGYLVAHARDQIPEPWLQDLESRLTAVGWAVSVQGRKVYAVPRGLSKASAVTRLAAQLGATSVLAAGDSLLDRPLLELAAGSGGAIRPAHGELHDLGWDGAHVTVESGARAGEELLRWLLERVG